MFKNFNLIIINDTYHFLVLAWKYVNHTPKHKKKLPNKYYNNNTFFLFDSQGTL